MSNHTARDDAHRVKFMRQSSADVRTQTNITARAQDIKQQWRRTGTHTQTQSSKQTNDIASIRANANNHSSNDDAINDTQTSIPIQITRYVIKNTQTAYKSTALLIAHCQQIHMQCVYSIHAHQHKLSDHSVTQQSVNKENNKTYTHANQHTFMPHHTELQKTKPITHSHTYRQCNKQLRMRERHTNIFTHVNHLT